MQHARGELLGGRGNCPDQGEEVVGPAGDADGGRGRSDGRLDLAAVGEVLGAEPHRHGHGRHEQVHHIADHPPHNKRVHVRRHGCLVTCEQQELR
jgi:hypothetical protein